MKTTITEGKISFNECISRLNTAKGRIREKDGRNTNTLQHT